MTLAADDDAPLRIDLIRGNPTPEELAAVVAVVTEAYQQEAASATAVDSTRRSAWLTSARAVRRPLRRHIGWGRFSG